MSKLVTIAGVAQLVEQMFCKHRVGGSSPSASSIHKIKYKGEM